MAEATQSAKRTTDHDTIRRWAEQRGGKPAHVKGTGKQPGDPGILRIDFPGDGSDPNLEPISWEEWFRAFDENRLAFLYEDETSESLQQARQSRSGRHVGANPHPDAIR